MFDDFRHRMHPRGVLFNAIERTFLTTSDLLITLVALLVLFFAIYLRVA
jgi:hypothetical protein